MRSWQQFKEVKENLNENHASFARMAADAALRAAGSAENPDYFIAQCKKAMEYLQQAIQAQPQHGGSDKERQMVIKAYQRGIIDQEEMEQRLAQLGG